MSKSEEKISDQLVKVVLRRLPKFMSEKEVLEQISPLPKEVTHTYFRPANPAFDRSAFATLTLLFSEYCDSLVDFESRFNGYIFVDSRGNDSPAVVEAAVNQSFSKRDLARIKEDNRIGAVLNDKYYLEFCEKLEEEKSIPVMTLEQQIKKLNRPEDARTQIERLETPLVKYFFDKEIGKRRDDTRRNRREEKRVSAKQAKNVMDILLTSSKQLPSSSATTRQWAKKEKEGVQDEKEQERQAKLEIKRKERDALRKKKFMLEKKKKMEEKDQDQLSKPPTAPRENKRKERSAKPVRPSPAKTLSEQQGDDWIKKLTDPKTNFKKKHDPSEPNKLTILELLVGSTSQTTPSSSCSQRTTASTFQKSHEKKNLPIIKSTTNSPENPKPVKEKPIQKQKSISQTKQAQQLKNSKLSTIQKPSTGQVTGTSQTETGNLKNVTSKPPRRRRNSKNMAKPVKPQTSS